MDEIVTIKHKTFIIYNFVKAVLKLSLASELRAAMHRAQSIEKKHICELKHNYQCHVSFPNLFGKHVDLVYLIA